MTPKPTPDFVIETVAEYFGTCERAIKSKMGFNGLSETRMIIAYLLFKHTILDTVRIGSKLNRRTDYANHAIDVVIVRKKHVPEFAKKFEMAEKHLLNIHDYCHNIDRELINAPVNS